MQARVGQPARHGRTRRRHRRAIRRKNPRPIESPPNEQNILCLLHLVRIRIKFADIFLPASRPREKIRSNHVDDYLRGVSCQDGAISSGNFSVYVTCIFDVWQFYGVLQVLPTSTFIRNISMKVLSNTRLKSAVATAAAAALLASNTAAAQSWCGAACAAAGAFDN